MGRLSTKHALDPHALQPHLSGLNAQRRWVTVQALASDTLLHCHKTPLATHHQSHTNNISGMTLQPSQVGKASYFTVSGSGSGSILSCGAQWHEVKPESFSQNAWTV